MDTFVMDATHRLKSPATPKPEALVKQLITEFTPLVRRIAYQLMARLPASVQVEDVIQNGMLGLMDAVGRFEEGMGARFETYATQRIRGAMLDGLRDNDWMPRSLRRDMRRIDVACRTLEQHHGRPPAEIEIAKALDMPLADYQRTVRDARSSQIMNFEDFHEDGDEDFIDRQPGQESDDPLHQLIARDDEHALLNAIAQLPDRERMMMRLYYEEDLNLKEIGDILGVSESRVCQLHKQAVSRLRAHLASDSMPPARGARKMPTPAAYPHQPARSRAPMRPAYDGRDKPGVVWPTYAKSATPLGSAQRANQQSPQRPPQQSPQQSPQLSHLARNQPVLEAVVG